MRPLPGAITQRTQLPRASNSPERRHILGVLRSSLCSGLARLVQIASQPLLGEVEAKGFVDLSHDVGRHPSDPGTNSLYGH